MALPRVSHTALLFLRYELTCLFLRLLLRAFVDTFVSQYACYFMYLNVNVIGAAVLICIVMYQHIRACNGQITGGLTCLIFCKVVNVIDKCV